MRYAIVAWAGLLCLISIPLQAQVYNPDLWEVTTGDPIEAYLDAGLFENGVLPAGIEAVLDRRDDLAVVCCGEVQGLVKSSAHVLDLAAGQACHIRPAHTLVSASISPDRLHLAAVLSAPCDHCLVVYSLADGSGRRLKGAQAAPGSVIWQDADRIRYLPWIDGKAGTQPVDIDITQAATESVFGDSKPGDGSGQPEVYSCGGTNDDCICGGNNPYPCCSNGGNCTWWAWHMACCNWGRACPGWGNANTWLAYSQNSGYPTTGTPTVGSIACDSNGTLSSLGHVAWVLQVSGNSVLVSEQSCGGGYGSWQTWYYSWVFDGYILNPSDPCAGTDNAAGISESPPYDGDTVTTGQVFSKSWTVQNTGTSTWRQSCNHKWAFDGGTSFGAPGWIDLGGGEAIAPGQTKTWTLNLTAPSTPGTYQGYFIMDRYGTGRFGDRNWILVNVVSPGGNLTGTVTNAGSGAAISGATVSLSGVGSTTTNTSGTYTFSNVNAGGYLVSVSAAAFNVAGANITINAGATTTQNFALTASDTQPPSVPTGLIASATSPTSVQLSWTASTDNTGVSGYDIRRDGIAIGSSSTNSYADNSAPADTTLVYEVRARDVVPNYSAWSAPAQTTTPPLPPTSTMVFQDGFNGGLGNWTQQVESFDYSTTANRGGIAGAGAAYMAAGQKDQMYHGFARPFAQAKAKAWFWDGKGGWKTSVCGWSYRTALSVRDKDNAGKMYIDNEFYNAPDNSQYYYRLIGTGGGTHTPYASRDGNTDCEGAWVCFETEVIPGAPGASPTGTFVAKVTDRAGTTATTQNLTADYFAWGVGRVTLGLGVTSSNEGYWDDVSFEATPPARPTFATPSVISDTAIRWNFAPADSRHFGWEIMDGSGTTVAPSWPSAGWIDHNATGWTESGLTPNTAYTRKIMCWNGTLDSSATPPRTAWTLSPPPGAASLSSDAGSVCEGQQVMWTAIGGFGPGKVEYYAYAWNHSPTYAFTGSEPAWTAGTLATQATAAGTWYLHVLGMNAADQPNGSHSYPVDAQSCEPPSIVAAVSRMTHGSAGDFAMDVAAAGAIECRAGGPVLLVVSFDRPIQGAGGLDVGDVAVSSGSVSNVSINGSELSITMSGAADGHYLIVALPGIVSAAGLAAIDSLCIGTLAGDTSGDGTTNIFDLIVVRNMLNVPVTAVDYVNDVNADGQINIFDLIVVRNNLNHTLGGTCP